MESRDERRRGVFLVGQDQVSPRGAVGGKELGEVRSEKDLHPS